MRCPNIQPIGKSELTKMENMCDHFTLKHKRLAPIFTWSKDRRLFEEQWHNSTVEYYATFSIRNTVTIVKSYYGQW